MQLILIDDDRKIYNIIEIQDDSLVTHKVYELQQNGVKIRCCTATEGNGYIPNYQLNKDFNI